MDGKASMATVSLSANVSVNEIFNENFIDQNYFNSYIFLYIDYFECLHMYLIFLIVG